MVGLALLAEGVAPLPKVIDRCTDEKIWRQTEQHLCPQIPREAINTVLFLPASNHDIGRIIQQTLAMQFSLACDLKTINGYSGRRPELILPLLSGSPLDFPCQGVRAILDRVHQESGKGVLIHIDQQPPLGLEQYPVAAVSECLASCLTPDPAWYTPLPDRPADIFVTDSEAHCSPSSP